jgi:hypothetical protein
MRKRNKYPLAKWYPPNEREYMQVNGVWMDAREAAKMAAREARRIRGALTAFAIVIMLTVAAMLTVLILPFEVMP